MIVDFAHNVNISICIPFTYSHSVSIPSYPFAVFTCYNISPVSCIFTEKISDAMQNLIYDASKINHKIEVN